jgi:hypothetical protein
MKRLLTKRFFARLAGLLIALVVLGIGALLIYEWILLPQIDRWGATDAEIAAGYPGDELVPAPLQVVNRAVTIHASPEEIYPWLLQLGADRAGLYSYTVLEGMANCPMTNADRIHPEWQGLKVGDLVKLCAKEPGPPPYIVAALTPNRSMVLGHQDNGRWVEEWEFNLVPQADGTTRLITRTRTTTVGGFWEVLHPITFVMERAMLLGVKARAEK